MSKDLRFSTINTSFDKQQNPLRIIELPCDKEYRQINLGSCVFLNMLESPTDVKVYISLNENRKNAFQLTNRNTGFRVSEVFSEGGVPSQVNEVYLWTEGITSLTDEQGNPKKVSLVVSGLYHIEILTNASVNQINQVGQIGSVQSGKIDRIEYVAAQRTSFPDNAIHNWIEKYWYYNGTDYSMGVNYEVCAITAKQAKEFAKNDIPIQFSYHFGLAVFARVTSSNYSSMAGAVIGQIPYEIASENVKPFMEAPLVISDTPAKAQGFIDTILPNASQKNKGMMIDCYLTDANPNNKTAPACYHTDSMFQMRAKDLWNLSVLQETADDEIVFQWIISCVGDGAGVRVSGMVNIFQARP